MIRGLLLNQKDYENIALIEFEKKISYRQLIQKALAITLLLSKKNSNNIAILLPNGSDYLSAFWGILQAGLTAFPLNVLMTKHEILPNLKQAKSSVIITTTAYQHLIDENEESLFSFIFIDEITPINLNDPYAMKSINSDEPMLLLSTSGTTKKAKIVQLSERNVEAAVLGYLDKLSFDNRKDVRYTLAAPFSSVYGTMILSSCLIKSFPLIVFDTYFTLDTLYSMAEKYQITHYEGSASTILLMEQTKEKPIPFDIRTLNYFAFGGSKVSSTILENLINRYPDKEFYQGYGMTEAAPLITKFQQSKFIKKDSVGTAIKGMEIYIEFNDKLTNTPYLKGEIVVRGANVMLGYLNNQDETDLVLKNGFLYTGDIGYLDQEGYLYICGRKKNMVIIRGFKAYPEEIEACIQNSQLVLDCLVYGEIDGRGNEILCANIIPLNKTIGEEEIRKYCRVHLASYKIPKKIVFCETIQKNLNGKSIRFD